jgi:hypothetical protein
VIAFPLASPIEFWLMLTVLTAAPEFEIPVKPPLVAVEVFPLIILLLMVSEPGAELLPIAKKLLEDEAPVIAQLRILLLLILIAAVESVAIPWLLIPSKVPEVNPLVKVTVLFVIELVNVPAGVPTE